MHVDGGSEASYSFVDALVGELITAGPSRDHLDYKTVLQELAMKIGVASPTYVLFAEGPDHARRYSADVFVGGVVRGRGEGVSKKQAEQAAAREAYATLSEQLAS